MNTTTIYEVGQELVITKSGSMGCPLEAGDRVLVLEVHEQTLLVRTRGAGGLEWYVDKSATRPVGDADVEDQRRVIGELRDRVAALETEAQELRDRNASLAVGLDRFKAQVRDAAIGHAEGTDHCTDGLNEWLEALGLDPVLKNWKVTVTLFYTEIGSVIVTADDADDEDAAIDYVRDNLEIEFGDASIPVDISLSGSDSESDSGSAEYEVEGYYTSEYFTDRVIEALEFEAEPA